MKSVTLSANHSTMKTPAQKSAQPTKNQPGNAFFSTSSPAFFSKPVQTQLEIGEPGGHHEKEAEQVAEQFSEGPRSPLKNQISPITTANVSRETNNTTATTSNAQNNFQQTLSAQTGKGEQLNDSIKGEMESAFGEDFSRVRIHTDNTANKMANTLGANAFATGQDVFFKSGNYNPTTEKGKRLLAHELAHTIQQKSLSASDTINRSIIQGEQIRYRSITWDDFELAAPEGSSHDAAVHAGVRLSQGENWASQSWTQTGDTEYRVTITFNRDVVELYAYMDTAQSWKSAWLTDDDAARQKLGATANIAAARSSLLSHEQLHFTNARTAASRYEQDVKNCVPATPYEETFTAADNDAASAQAIAILERKGSEINALIDAVIERANAELGQVQSIYDADTNHSQNETAQQAWIDDYDERYREARERDMSQDSEEEGEGHDHEHETE